MRMNADGGVNEFVLCRECDAAVQRAWTCSAADGHDCLDTRVSCPNQHLLAVGIELFHLEVGVGVNEHDGQLVSLLADRYSFAFCNLSSAIYFNLVPTGTSSRKLHSTGFPPSADAATIIPFDSNPRNFLGARLATITTLRPISVSGAYASAMPATTCRISVPRSTSSRNSLSAPLTFSATFTCPTRNSILAKSSILILPSIADGLAAGVEAAG